MWESGNVSGNVEPAQELVRGTVDLGGDPGDQTVQILQVVLSWTMSGHLSTLTHPKAWDTIKQGKLGAHWRHKLREPLGTVQGRRAYLLEEDFCYPPQHGNGSPFLLAAQGALESPGVSIKQLLFRYNHSEFS